ncbi:MAG: MFS transporter [Firmicutes bacterium]|jgi:EmrB/QacA subfamily drug resistance transporter|uniref:MFS transporter n=1 Tax=Sulfobacillus benefaciens TaxID=453960 RepID=A0A2T2X9Z4_9FIRM|nr:MFS transporter [Bacillota bacterium]MCL5015370.1 MFS transporter [Bacillota bacterium]PSR31310.1 MAG: MFS transporter [Sulfobacillus benefaciens]
MATLASKTRRATLQPQGNYKWIALSNTTLGMLMATINQTILIISLPAVFRGIHVNPLHSGQTSLLLWILMGFNVATTILLVSFGRISDTYGRVRLYNLGFLVFTLGSILLFLTPGKGTAGEWELIIFRFVQGIGGAFLFANSAAILTDAFPVSERGLALGLNQIAAIGGGVLGLVLGGLLSAIDWRAIFLVNVPVGLFGTVWAYIALRELSTTQDARRIDWWGNITFALGLLGIMVGLTYSISPYGHHAMGWQSPLVIASLIIGVLSLIVFLIIENLVEDPMFHLALFRIRAFSIGNFTSLLGAIARGGLSFMLIIWLQGIWLPLHGVSFANTPLQAGIDTIPQMIGFLVFGPISGRLSDRYGPRVFATLGMLVSAIGFILLNTLPADFHYWTFAFYIFIVGAGMGLFASPNTSAIMSAVPARFRGSASGMRATFMNAGMTLSMGIFFTMVISSLSTGLPSAITKGLRHFAIPKVLVVQMAHLPPLDVLFAALLGYNPLKMMLGRTAAGRAVLTHLPGSQAAILTGSRFFPQLIAHPFMEALRLVFVFSAAMTFLSAILSVFRGSRFIYDDAQEMAPAAAGAASSLVDRTLLLALISVWLVRDGAEPDAPKDRQNQLRRALAMLSTALNYHSAERAQDWNPGEDEEYDEDDKAPFTANAAKQSVASDFYRR